MATNITHTKSYSNEIGEKMQMVYYSDNDQMTLIYCEEWSAFSMELNREWAYALRDFINNNFGVEQ